LAPPPRTWLIFISFGVVTLALHFWLKRSPRYTKPRRLVAIAAIQSILFMIVVRTLWTPIPWLLVVLVLAVFSPEPPFRAGMFSVR
jgi:hypothetical protein